MYPLESKIGAGGAKQRSERLTTNRSPHPSTELGQLQAVRSHPCAPALAHFSVRVTLDGCGHRARLAPALQRGLKR